MPVLKGFHILLDAYLMDPFRKSMLEQRRRFYGLEDTDNHKLIKEAIVENIIYDEQQHRVLLITDVLVPEYAEKIIRIVGDESVNMLIENNTFMFITDERVGSLEYSDVTKNYFTKYFKILVGWEQEYE